MCQGALGKTNAAKLTLNSLAAVFTKGVSLPFLTTPGGAIGKGSGYEPGETSHWLRLSSIAFQSHAGKIADEHPEWVFEPICVTGTNHSIVCVKASNEVPNTSSDAGGGFGAR
jgi:hypothetical protein